MESSEALTKQKQTYLRQEIIEKQYDAGAFVEFLAQIKPDGEDLDNWTMDELTQLVTQFQVANPPNSTAQVLDLNESQDEDGVRQANMDSSAQSLSSTNQTSLENSESVPEGIAPALVNNQDTSDNHVPEGEPQIETIKQSGGVELRFTQEFELKSKPRQKVFLNELSGEKRLRIRIHE